MCTYLHNYLVCHDPFPLWWKEWLCSITHKLLGACACDCESLCACVTHGPMWMVELYFLVSVWDWRQISSPLGSQNRAGQCLVFHRLPWPLSSLSHLPSVRVGRSFTTSHMSERGAESCFWPQGKFPVTQLRHSYRNTAHSTLELCRTLTTSMRAKYRASTVGVYGW